MLRSAVERDDVEMRCVDAIVEGDGAALALTGAFQYLKTVRPRS